jgi:hypothetical protein
VEVLEDEGAEIGGRLLECVDERLDRGIGELLFGPLVDERVAEVEQDRRREGEPRGILSGSLAISGRVRESGWHATTQSDNRSFPGQ